MNFKFMSNGPEYFLKKYKLHEYNKTHSEKLHVIMSHYCFYCESCGAKLVWPCIADLDWLGEEAIGFKASLEEADEIEERKVRQVVKSTENSCPICGKKIPEEYYCHDTSGNPVFLNNEAGIWGKFMSWYDEEKGRRYADWHNNASEETTYDITDEYDEQTYHKKIANSFKEMQNLRVKYKKDLAIPILEASAQTFIEENTLAPTKKDSLLSITEANSVKDDPKRLTAYINKAMEIEQNRQSLEARIKSLWMDDGVSYIEKNEAIKEYNDSQASVIEEQEQVINMECDAIRKAFDSSNYGLSLITIPDPPGENLVPPQLPEYKKPGLFNKKTIQAENDRLKEAFDQQMRTYESLKKMELENYQKYREDVLRIEKENQDILRQISEKRQADIEQLELKKKARLKEIHEQYQQQTPMLPENIIYDLTHEELDYAKEAYTQLLNTRSCFYNSGIVFGKYQNLPAMATIYEYLASGRCQSLEGSDGAYNLYESETRTNAIITKLDTVIEKLDDIRESQYSLCSAVASIQFDLNSISSKMNEACNSLKSIDTSTSLTAANTNDIARNTAVSAYYAQKAAYYSKILAEVSVADFLIN